MARTKKQSTQAAVREIRRKTRRKFAPEEKVRIVLEGLRGEQSISELCRREGIASNLYYRWSKDFLEAGKKQLAGHLATGRRPLHRHRCRGLVSDVQANHVAIDTGDESRPSDELHQATLRGYGSPNARRGCPDRLH